ncbi:Protein of unknown function (DUF3112) domain containing protein [Hyaloscypha variabilis]
MSSPGGAQAPKGPPYLPTTAGLGGLPTKQVDDPISAVFLVLFVMGAATHMAILQINLRRKKKFVMSGLIFGFCMARITTMTMRLVWASYPHNISVAIAAQIFVSAGVLILFIVNLIFVQRIVRASHPHWAWAKWFSLAFKLYYVSIVLMLIALITCTVQSFYTLDHNIRRIDHDVQLVGGTYFAVAAFLPIPLMFLRIIIPDRPPIEKFGHGRFRTKIFILLFSSVLLTLGAAFRAGINYVPRPSADPAWYDSKECFYLFNFTIEIIVVALYAIIRVDKRFHVPDGSHGPGDYIGISKGGVERRPSFADRVLDEEQVFDEGSAEELRKRRPDLEHQEVITFTPTRPSHEKEVEPTGPLGGNPTPPDLENKEVATFAPTGPSHEKEVEPTGPLGSNPTPPDLEHQEVATFAPTGPSHKKEVEPSGPPGSSPTPPDLEHQEVATFAPTDPSHEKEVEPTGPLGSNPTPPASVHGSAHESNIQQTAEPAPPVPAVSSRPVTAHDEEKSAAA